jgi:DNA-binding transcriptional LysR family regulator
MDLRRVRQFVVLADVLNFRKAAERLHIAQPALSVSIKKLEGEVGAELFERSAAGVALTAAGRAALPEARRLLFHSQQLVDAVRSVGLGEGGVVRLGFVGSSTYSVLPRLVPRFRGRYPKIELVLRQATSSQIVQMIDEETLDVGLVRIPVVASSTVALLPLEHEQFAVALPASHALAAGPVVPLQSLADEPFLMYPADTSPGLRAAAMMACETAGFVPRIAQEATQIHTLLALVESGLGVALVPDVMKRFSSDKVAIRPLAPSERGAAIALALALAYRPDLENIAARRFRDVAQSLFEH